MPDYESFKSFDRIAANLQGEKPIPKSQPKQGNPRRKFRKTRWIVSTSIIFTTVVAIANIPYRIVRDPVIRTVPFLLFPSMVSWDYQCSQAIAQIDKAESQLDQAQEPADLDSVKNLLTATQKHLDTLPAPSTSAYDLWGGGTVSCPRASDIQARIRKTGLRLSDEQQAQAQYSVLHNSLVTTKVQYKQAQTPDLKEFEYGEWLSALTKLGQLSPTTLAGRQAQAELAAEMEEYQALERPE